MNDHVVFDEGSVANVPESILEDKIMHSENVNGNNIYDSALRHSNDSVVLELSIDGGNFNLETFATSLEEDIINGQLNQSEEAGNKIQNNDQKDGNMLAVIKEDSSRPVIEGDLSSSFRPTDITVDQSSSSHNAASSSNLESDSKLSSLSNA